MCSGVSHNCPESFFEGSISISLKLILLKSGRIFNLQSIWSVKIALSLEQDPVEFLQGFQQVGVNMDEVFDPPFSQIIH